MAARIVRCRSGRSRAPPVRNPSRSSRRASIAGGESSLALAAASSIPRGSPSNRAQISATASAVLPLGDGARRLGDGQCARDRGGDEVWLANGGECDEERPVVELACERRDGLERETGLASPAWTCERHEPYIVASQQRDEGGQLA